MNLQSDWAYILEVAERRLKYNKTPRHIASEKGRLEIIGAAGEVAARRFLGLPERLHNHFDGGVDLNWRGYRIDVKSTGFAGHLRGPQPKHSPDGRPVIILTSLEAKCPFLSPTRTMAETE
jgi:hypothetical protein